jgi:DNA-binding NtrC family response regulator
MSEKILVVDDEESIRFTFKTFLAEKGLGTVTAPDFKTALSLIEENDFDVVFTDIVLGGKTGIDLLKEIKRRNPLCPVVVITGAPSLDTAAEAVRLGAYDYIVKPVRQDTLLRIVDMALKHRAVIEERERYRTNLDAIFSGLRDGIVLMDKEMRIIEANDAFLRTCGSSRGKVTGKTCGAAGLCQCGEFAAIVGEAFRTRKHLDSGRVECKDPKRLGLVVSHSVSPLIDAQGKFSGAVVLIKDETRLDTLERELKERSQLHTIVGKSRKMQEVYSLIDSLASVDSTALITGESGTGKELIADALHYGGTRRENPYIKVNCSSLTESLLESELFGHVRGAFTGAVTDREGRFKAADGGTIFLDEIGDISPSLQLRLLRVLQNKEIERVGESRPVKVDVRVIAATNKDLRALMRKGAFREDLFYRLKVVEIHASPLRERKEDIPLLVEHFLARLNRRLGKSVTDVSTDVLRLFMVYGWPGNVRELEHALEHAVVVCAKSVITTDDLSPELVTGTEGSSPLPENERQKVLEALQRAGGNKTRAAALLGISRRTIYRKLQEHGIEDSELKEV